MSSLLVEGFTMMIFYVGEKVFIKDDAVKVKKEFRGRSFIIKSVHINPPCYTGEIDGKTRLLLEDEVESVFVHDKRLGLLP